MVKNHLGILNAKMETRFQFLNRLYLPGYMGLRTEAYDKRSGIFDFTPTEPPVTVLSSKYMTPRGAHIFISQAGLCLVEHVLVNESFPMDTQEYRSLTMDGRIKIVELTQRFRREISLDTDLQGRVELTNIRWGRLPMIMMDFDLANQAISGSLVGVLAPRPMSQTNSDILRN